jgi:hypothetical protein
MTEFDTRNYGELDALATSKRKMEDDKEKIWRLSRNLLEDYQKIKDLEVENLQLEYYAQMLERQNKALRYQLKESNKKIRKIRSYSSSHCDKKKLRHILSLCNSTSEIYLDFTMPALNEFRRYSTFNSSKYQNLMKNEAKNDAGMVRNYELWEV